MRKKTYKLILGAYKAPGGRPTHYQRPPIKQRVRGSTPEVKPVNYDRINSSLIRRHCLARPRLRPDSAALRGMWESGRHGHELDLTLIKSPRMARKLD